MTCMHFPSIPYPVSSKRYALLRKCFASQLSATYMVYPSKGIYAKKGLPEHLRRRPRLPPVPGADIVLKTGSNGEIPTQEGVIQVDEDGSADDENVFGEGIVEEDGDGVGWEAEEIEAISSLFQGRIPQKPGRSIGERPRSRPLPLPLPYKLRPLGFPTPKRGLKFVAPSVVASRAPVVKRVYKNPEFLIGLARDVRCLSSDEEVCEVLDRSSRFMRKGSLSLTIRELGHMGLPGRALQVFCWAQKQPHLFPDDRILASTVEVLAKNQELKVPVDVEKFVTLASREVIEAMVRGFIKGRSLNLALKLLRAVKRNRIVLGSSIYAKLILELGKNPDKHTLILPLLSDLAGRETLDLNQPDCIAIMKICIRLRRFEIVDTLFLWYKESGRDISIVMYTTVLHTLYCEEKYREAVALIWEMEAADCLFNLPAYRVVIKLFVVMKDLPRAARYYSKLKDSGFSPTYDIYNNMIKFYLDSGRVAKCKKICREAEMAGFKLDKRIMMQLYKDDGRMSSKY